MQLKANNTEKKSMFLTVTPVFSYPCMKTTAEKSKHAFSSIIIKTVYKNIEF